MTADLYFRGEKRPAALWSSRAKRAAFGLTAANLSGGAKKVGLLLPNGFDFIEATVGISHAAACPVPISTDLSVADYRSLAARERFDALITTPDLSARWGAPTTTRHFLVGGEASGLDSWEHFIASAPQTGNLHDRAAAPGQIFFTSGSTRTPKTVVRDTLPPDIAALRGARFARAWGMAQDMRTVITGPLYHQAPLY